MSCLDAVNESVMDENEQLKAENEELKRLLSHRKFL